MSYDIGLVDPDTSKPILFDEKHHITGGTYCLGGTHEACLNVTYNYSGHFVRVLGKDGIRRIYGMTGEESIPVLTKAIEQLADDRVDDYWEATGGNARAALVNLRTLAEMAPQGVWKGD